MNTVDRYRSLDPALSLKELLVFGIGAVLGIGLVVAVLTWAALAGWGST